jgi:hypothetical protein
MASCAGQLLLLCATSLRSVGLRHWDERLDLLVSQSRPEEAIHLGLRMLNGKAKAMHGLKGTPNQRKRQLRDKVIFFINVMTIALLTNYCNFSFRRLTFSMLTLNEF